MQLFHFQLPNFFLKLAHFKNEKCSLGETKINFCNFKGFILVKFKIRGDKSFEYEQGWKLIRSFVAGVFKI